MYKVRPSLPDPLLAAPSGARIVPRLAAVRRIAYEAADAGLLSPELAAGIRCVKGVRRIGVRLGNWLTPEQGRRLLAATTPGFHNFQDYGFVVRSPSAAGLGTA
jgi:hypothetical protein